MTDGMFMPCDDWSEKLASPREDLTVSDRVALEAHFASCPACSLTNIDDDMISKLIQALPAPNFPPELPPRLLWLREETRKQEFQEPNASAALLPDAEQTLIKKLQWLQEQGVRDNEKLAPEVFTSEQLPSRPEVEEHPKDVFQSKRLPPQQERRFTTGAFTDQILYCPDCNAEFVFTAGEQEFYASRGLTKMPSRCPSCRSARKAQGGDRYSGRRGGSNSGGGYRDRDPRQMYTVICSCCGNETLIPFQPRGDKPVYCSDCYNLGKARGTIHDHRHKF